jgi:hypothetical protein
MPKSTRVTFCALIEIKRTAERRSANFKRIEIVENILFPLILTNSLFKEIYAQEIQVR